MTPLLRLASLRHFARHPWQAVLAVTGIALGVAIVVSIELATSSARHAFELSSSAVFGRATHQLTAGSAGIPDTMYRVLAVDLGVRAAPVVLAHATLHGARAASAVRLLGVDPLAEAPFRSWLTVQNEDVDAGVLLARPGAILLPVSLAERLGAAAGDTVTLRLGGTDRRAWIAGLVHPADALSRQALADLVLCDVSVAQELAGRTGRLDRIDLLVPAGVAGKQQLARIRAALPGAQLVETGARQRAGAAMTRAFELNLDAFAWMTLMFGALLVHNTMQFAVVQRRELIGRLRALGVTRREIVRLVLMEAAWLGALGTLLGIALGVVLATGLLRLVAQTVNDLYFAVSVRRVTLSLPALAKGLALGLGATFIAAAMPALEATSATPRSALSRSLLESKTGRAIRRAARFGLVLLISGFVLAAWPSASMTLGFASLFAVAVAAALLAPQLTVWLLGATRPLAARLFGRLGSLAVGGVRGTMSRTAPAVAALTVAIAIGAAVSIMVSSFRAGVEQWLSATLGADVYVSAPSGGSGRREGTLRPDVVQTIRALPEVQGVTRYRDASVPLGATELRLVAVDLFPPHRNAFTFLEGDAETAWAAFDAGALLVSESFAFRHGVHPGDTVQLHTPRGAQPFAVAAVYRDYSSEFGVVFLHRRHYDALWNDPGVSSLALWLRPGIDADSLAAGLRARDFGQPLEFRSNRGLRNATLTVFDRTFTITLVLRALALLVAFAGVLAALMALQLERAREIGVLRALGLTPGQVRGLVSAQTGLIGLAAGILAWPLAAALAWLLIHVVNRRSFGWSMDMQLDPGVLLQALGLAMAAALLAGVYPAHRMARMQPAVAVREE